MVYICVILNKLKINDHHIGVYVEFCYRNPFKLDYVDECTLCS